MPKLYKIVLGALLLAVFFVAPVHAGEDQVFGTLTGAVVGGIVGNQFGHGDGRIATTTAGVLAGGWIGNDVGYSIDNSRSNSSTASRYTGPTSSGPVTYNTGYTPNYVGPNDSPPPESVYDDSSSYCREYSQLVRVGNRVQESYGTACLQPDGSWRAVDQ